MGEFQITLNEQEMQILIQSLDVNIRTNGLNVSANCTILAEKLNKELTKEQELEKD